MISVLSNCGHNDGNDDADDPGDGDCDQDNFIAVTKESR